VEVDRVRHGQCVAERHLDELAVADVDRGARHGRTENPRLVADPRCDLDRPMLDVEPDPGHVAGGRSRKRSRVRRMRHRELVGVRGRGGGEAGCRDRSGGERRRRHAPHRRGRHTGRSARSWQLRARRCAPGRRRSPSRRKGVAENPGFLVIPSCKSPR